MGLALVKRRFIIDDGSKRHTEEDPMPGAPIPQIKKLLSSKYPSITNSNFKEPIVDGNVMTYVFKAVGGTHG
jgi:PRTRC genetic system protein C